MASWACNLRCSLLATWLPYLAYANQVLYLPCKAFQPSHSLKAASLLAATLIPPTLPVIPVIILLLLCHLTLMNFSLYIINKLRAGNCCLRQPFSPVLKPRQGGGILIYAGLVNLAQDTSIYALLAVQAWGNPSAWRHVPKAPHLLVLSVGPIPSEPLPVHSSPIFAHIWVCVFFIARLNIKFTSL